MVVYLCFNNWSSENKFEKLKFTLMLCCGVVFNRSNKSYAQVIYLSVVRVESGSHGKHNCTCFVFVMNIFISSNMAARCFKIVLFILSGVCCCVKNV